MNYKQFRQLNKPKESQIQTEIMNYLLSKGFYVERMNAGRIRTESGHLIKLHSSGMPDIMAFKAFGMFPNREGKIVLLPDLLFVECKVLGNKPTLLQELKMKELEEYGGRCIIAHSVAEVEEQI